MTTEAVSNQKEYTTWRSMLARCNDPNHYLFRFYGNRGIKVTPEWSNFHAFYQDLGSVGDKQFLVRTDATEDYSKQNCQWVTFEQLQELKRTTKKYKNNEYDIALKSWD
jgi:hypothetical protein